MIVFYSILFILLLITLIVMIIYSIKNKKKGKKSSDSNSIDKSVLDLLPVLDYDSLHDCFVLSDGTYMDLVQIKSKDLKSLSDDEVLYDRLRYTKLYKKFSDDIKAIAINFPSNTDNQLNYIRYKIAHTKNEIYKEWLRKKEEECIWIADNRTSREFYYMFWGKNLDELIKNRGIIVETLETGKNGLVFFPDQEKKIAIIKKLNNKNMFLKKRGEKVEDERKTTSNKL